MTKHKHLNLDDRTAIELELGKSRSFRSISLLLGKDNTTISKEIRRHISRNRSGAYGKPFNDCFHSHDRTCTLRHVCTRCTSPKRLCWSCGKCLVTCHSYQKFVCPKLSRPPYVCNACTDRTKCTLEKAFYHASYAQKQYELLKRESRSGFAISEQELKTLDSVVSPLLKNGHSIHHIALNHPDTVMTSERTLYTYVNHGLFSARNLDMPRVVRMRPRKNKSRILKVDKTCRIHRTYDDYQNFLSAHPDIPVRQLDSVEGIKGGPVLLTIHFIHQELQLAFLRQANDSQSVIDIFHMLYRKLEHERFTQIFPVLLADNGSEFSNPKAIEWNESGERRTRMFYCNPNAPYEKPHCENNHSMIRRILPKGTDIGKYTQEQIDLMMSHINSYARGSLGNKSPYDVFAFQYGEDILKIFRLKRIPADEIILTPKLLKN